MDELYEKAKPLAAKVMSYARDSILVNMRFLDVVLSALVPEPQKELSQCGRICIFYFI